MNFTLLSAIYIFVYYLNMRDNGNAVQIRAPRGMGWDEKKRPMGRTVTTMSHGMGQLKKDFSSHGMGWDGKIFIPWDGMGPIPWDDTLVKYL